MNSSSNTLNEVREVIIETLGVQSNPAELTASTPLFGSLPEFDSMSVVLLVTELEKRFGIKIDDSEVSGDLFATLGTLVEFIDDKRRSGPSA